MDKQRFTFGIAVGTNHLRGDRDFLVRFNRYLTEKQVDPAEYEVVTIASCAGHSFVITREIPEGESEDIEYLTTRSYAKYGCMVLISAMPRASSGQDLMSTMEFELDSRGAT